MNLILDQLPNKKAHGRVEFHKGLRNREVNKTDIFLCTSVCLSQISKDLIKDHNGVDLDSHQAHLLIDDIYYKPSLGFACAYEFAANDEKVLVSGCYFTYSILKEALKPINKERNVVGYIDCKCPAEEFPKTLRAKLFEICSDWCLHILYNNGFSSAIPDAQFSHFCNIDPKHNAQAVESYVSPFIYLIKEFIEEFSLGESFIGVKTALAAQRVNAVQGIDPAVKHNMEGILRLATKDLQLRGIHFTQIKEGTVDMSFYDTPHNTAHNFYMAFKHQLGHTFAVEKRPSHVARDEAVRDILAGLLKDDYGDLSNTVKRAQYERDLSYINWLIDNNSVVSPAVSVMDFARAVYSPAKLFLDSRNSPTGKLTIPAIYILPYAQEQALGY